MGEIADWLIDRAMSCEYVFYGQDDDYDDTDEFNGYTRQQTKEYRLRRRLECTYWVDAKLRKLYPANGDMELSHILAVKAKLTATVVASKLHTSKLWKALGDGERLHEKKLQQVKDINKGVIQW